VTRAGTPVAFIAVGTAVGIPVFNAA